MGESEEMVLKSKDCEQVTHRSGDRVLGERPMEGGEQSGGGGDGEGGGGGRIVRGQSLRRLPRIDPPVVGRPSCPLEMGAARPPPSPPHVKQS